MPWISVASTEELRSQHTCEIVGADNNYSLFVDEKLASKGRLIAFIERANWYYALPFIKHYFLQDWCVSVCAFTFSAYVTQHSKALCSF